MGRTRDWRRSQKFKKREKARTIFKHVWEIDDPEDLEAQVQGRAENMQKCSCVGCGNPRRHTGELTLQEKKACIED